MTAWTGYSFEAITANAAHLARFVYEIQLTLAERGSNMSPGKMLILLR
jgi:hypothetical protein